jgi:hypothetical protein
MRTRPQTRSRSPVPQGGWGKFVRLSAGGSRIRTFRPSPDQCLSELVEPCAETTWRARGEFLNKQFCPSRLRLAAAQGARKRLAPRRVFLMSSASSAAMAAKPHSRASTRNRSSLQMAASARVTAASIASFVDVRASPRTQEVGHLYLAEGCHFYLAPIDGRITGLVENRHRHARPARNQSRALLHGLGEVKYK